MKKLSKKALRLTKETIRVLGVTELEHVAGGLIGSNGTNAHGLSCYQKCDTTSDDCGGGGHATPGCPV